MTWQPLVTRLPASGVIRVGQPSSGEVVRWSSDLLGPDPSTAKEDLCVFGHPGHNPQWLTCAHSWTWQPSHAPTRPSTTAPKRSLLVSTHRPHCVRRAGSPLAALSLSQARLEFLSLPSLSQPGRLTRHPSSPPPTSSYSASSSWAVGQRSPHHTCGNIS